MWVAVGVTRTQVLLLILRQVAFLAGIGLVVGLPLSLALGPLVGSLLFGVAPTDPLMITEAGVTMVGVALGAGWLPAWRASRLDPLLALRFGVIEKEVMLEGTAECVSFPDKETPSEAGSCG